MEVMHSAGHVSMLDCGLTGVGWGGAPHHTMTVDFSLAQSIGENFASEKGGGRQAVVIMSLGGKAACSRRLMVSKPSSICKDYKYTKIMYI